MYYEINKMNSLYHFLTTDQRKHIQTVSGWHSLLSNMVFTFLEAVFTHAKEGEVVFIAPKEMLTFIEQYGEAEQSRIRCLCIPTKSPKEEWSLFIYTDVLAAVLSALPIPKTQQFHIAWSIDPGVVETTVPYWIVGSGVNLVQLSLLFETITPTPHYQLINVILQKWVESEQNSTKFQEIEAVGWDILFIFEYDDSPHFGRFRMQHARQDYESAYTVQALNEVGWHTVIHPDDLPQVSKAHLRILEGETVEVNYRLLYPAGDIKWMQQLSRPEYDPIAQKVVRSYGYMRDITAQKMIEKRLGESEQRYRELFEHAPVMYALIENREGHPYLIDCNETFLRTLGYERNDILGQPVSAYVTEETRKAIIEEGGFQRGMAGKLVNAPRELVKKDGQVIQALVEAVPYSDTFGIVRGVRAQYVDVTLWYEAERKVRESEARYRDIFENSPAMYVILKEYNGIPIIVDCNTRFLSVLGYDRREVIGHPSSEFYADPTHRMYENGGFRHATIYGYLEGEKELRTKKGIVIPTRIDGVAFYNENGEFAGVRIAMITIADLKNVEQKLQRANAELEQRVQERTASLARANRQMNAQIHQMQKVEAELRESRNRLLYFYENASDLIQILQADGTITFVNQAWQKTLGYTANEAKGTSILNFLQPENLLFYSQEYHAIKNGGITDYATSVTMLAKDGSVIEVEASITFHIENGAVVESFAVMRDVTTKHAVEQERAVVQAELLASRNRLLYLYENANDLIHIVTYSDPSQVNFINRKWLTTLGYTLDEVLGHDILDFFAPEEHQYLMDTFAHAMAQGISSYAVDSVMLTKDKRRIEVEASLSISYDETGSPGETLGILRDVTVQRHAKREQDIIEARYRNIVQSLPNTSIILFDTDTRYILVDGMDVETYGVKREWLIGETFTDMLKQVQWSPQLGRLLDAHYAALRGESTILEFSFANRIMRLQLNPMHTHGVINGGMLIATDITQDRQREQQLREAKDIAEAAAQTKNFFLANMSHEIRTPLNGIVGFTRLLANTSLTSEQKEYAASIIRSSDTLLNLLSDILDFSKIEAERLDIITEPFHICDVLEEVEQIYAPQAYAKGLDFNSDLDFAVPENLIGDATRIRQILMNLFSNALKFTAIGSILFQINGTATQEGGYNLCLTVQDTGIGIEPEQQRLIFETFTQADNTTTRRYGGTGLGLAICKRLAELMGGTITVQSEVGKGATFTVTVQCGIAAHLPNRFPHNSDPMLAEKQAILVMAPTTAHIFARMLQTWGVTPTILNKIVDIVPTVTNAPFEFAFLEQEAEPFSSNTEGFYAVVTEIQNRGIHPIIVNHGTTGHQWDYNETNVTVISKPLRPSYLHQTLVNTLTGTPISSPTTINISPLNTDFALEFPLQILLAEDNAVNQQVILAILRRLGYQPDLARDGREAVKSVASSSYDVVLMDIQMPIVSGVEAAEQIRAMGRRIHQPRIIALTANVLAGQKESYLSTGMDDYLSKPLNIEALMVVLAEAAATKPVLQSTKGFNPLVLMELREVLGVEGEEMVRQIVQLYLDELPERLLRIQIGRTVARWEEVSSAAHTLKGSSSSIGAIGIAATCAEIEMAVRMNSSELVPSLISRLTIEVAEIKAALQPLMM